MPQKNLSLDIELLHVHLLQYEVTAIFITESH